MKRVGFWKDSQENSWERTRGWLISWSDKYTGMKVIAARKQIESNKSSTEGKSHDWSESRGAGGWEHAWESMSHGHMSSSQLGGARIKEADWNPAWLGGGGTENKGRVFESTNLMGPVQSVERIIRPFYFWNRRGSDVVYTITVPRVNLRWRGICRWHFSLSGHG